MKTLLFSAVLAAAPCLYAQEESAAHEMPNPKTEAHAALQTLVGNWTTTCKMAAMPGVPGMEEPTEWIGTERAESICNGLWVKTTIDSECKANAQGFQGLWIAGYDPTTKKYRGVWVSSMDEPCSESEGTYDAATKTWTFTGSSPQGDFRSVAKIVDADTVVETCYMKTPDGNEVESMRIDRKRQKAAPAAHSTGAKPEKWATEHHERLGKTIGDWSVTTKCMAPGQPPVEEKGSERVLPICDGKWFWSDFEGSMMGQPFEGHSLIGWDATKKTYVSYWFDSMSATPARAEGTFDAKTNAWTFEGECLDPFGNKAKIRETYVLKDDDTRDLHMTFEGPDGKQEMQIHYVRKAR